MNDHEQNTGHTEANAEGKPEVKVEQVIRDFVDHQANSMREAVKAVDALLPEGFKQHGKNSLQEAVKSYQVLFDAGLEVLNRAGKSVDEALKRAQDNLKEEGDDQPSSTGTNKVRVEVE
jgi:hypothetical protein